MSNISSPIFYFAIWNPSSFTKGSFTYEIFSFSYLSCSKTYFIILCSIYICSFLF